MAGALRGLPLVVTLLREDAPGGPARRPPAEGCSPRSTVLGSAEIDLAQLLHPRCDYQAS